MNKEWKDKWTEALRSGKYKQTQHCLHDDKGFCCLGVLCDISGVGGWEISPKVRESLAYITSSASFTSYTPPEVVQLVFARNAGFREKTLVEMNDSGVPFSEIADWIDSNL